jgi:alpha-N-arabinofuranosidase
VHQNAKMIPVTIKTDDYTFGDEKLPSVSASASKDSAGLIHISLTNINSKKEETISLTLEGEKFSKVTGRILTSSKLQDHNTFEDPGKIIPQVFKGASLKGDLMTVKLPPFSVVVLELK